MTAPERAAIEREIERLEADAHTYEAYPSSRLAPRADLDALADVARREAKRLRAHPHPEPRPMKAETLTAERATKIADYLEKWVPSHEYRTAIVVDLRAHAAALSATEAGLREVSAHSRELGDRILGALEDFAGQIPEDDESWESWFHAAFDMARAKVGPIVAELSALSSERAAAEAKPVDGEPVAWIVKSNLASGKSALSAQGLSDAERAAGWTETPLYDPAAVWALIEQERVDANCSFAAAEARGREAMRDECARAADAEADRWPVEIGSSARVAAANIRALSASPPTTEKDAE